MADSGQRTADSGQQSSSLRLAALEDDTCTTTWTSVRAPPLAVCNFTTAQPQPQGQHRHRVKALRRECFMLPWPRIPGRTPYRQTAFVQALPPTQESRPLATQCDARHAFRYCDTRHDDSSGLSIGTPTSGVAPTASSLSFAGCRAFDFAQNRLTDLQTKPVLHITSPCTCPTRTQTQVRAHLADRLDTCLSPSGASVHRPDSSTARRK
jgi:hypothetical protein